MKEIKCRFCGFPIRHGKKFCGGCGKNATLATAEQKLPEEQHPPQSVPDVSNEQSLSKPVGTPPGTQSNESGSEYPLSGYPIGDDYPMADDNSYPLGDSDAPSIGANGYMVMAGEYENPGTDHTASGYTAGNDQTTSSAGFTSGSYPLAPPTVAPSGAYPSYPGRPTPVETTTATAEAPNSISLRKTTDNISLIKTSDLQTSRSSVPQPRPAQHDEPGSKPADKQYLSADYFAKSKKMFKGLTVPPQPAPGRGQPQSQQGTPPHPGGNSQNAPSSNPSADAGARPRGGFATARSGGGQTRTPDAAGDSSGKRQAAPQPPAPRAQNSGPDFFDMAPGNQNRKVVAPPPSAVTTADENEDFLVPSRSGQATKSRFSDGQDTGDEPLPSRKRRSSAGEAGPGNESQAKPPGWVASNLKMLKAATAVVIFSMLVVVVLGVVICLQKPPPKPALTLDGNFTTVRRDQKGNQVNGTITLARRGEEVRGNGVQLNDRFIVQGTIDENNHVEMEQVFLNNDGSYSQRYAPINIQADLKIGQDFAGNPVRAIEGSCSAAVSNTGSLMSRIRSFRCSWVATEQAQARSFSFIGWLTDTRTPMAPKLSLILVACIAFGLSVVVASFKIFGPNGILNVREKKKYIPSQVQSDHDKILKELGAPLKPGGLPLGLRKDWTPTQSLAPKNLSLPPQRRKKNPTTLVLGASGHGKSKLLESMIRHDILSGDRAVVVIDSAGTLIDRLVTWLASQTGQDASDLHARVRIIDPLAGKPTHGFNPLAATSVDELHQLAASVVTGFKCIYMEAPGSQNQWTQQTANILRNAVILLGLNNKTLGDMNRLLSDNDFRDLLLANVEANNQNNQHEVLLDAWVNYKRMARTEQWITWIEPIINRLQPVMADNRIRRLLCDRKLSINAIEILEEKHILLVKVPRARLEQGAGLLGSLIVSGIRYAAVKLSDDEEENPCPCALYVDEMADFVDKDCFEALSGETRQLQIGLTGVMRSVQSLPEDFRNTLSKNLGLLITFALTRKDAELFGPQMFRVDGRKAKTKTISQVMNPVNTSPQFELISDEEKLNVDRLTGQEEQTFFCYLMGSIAGVFQLRSPVIDDISRDEVNRELVEDLYAPLT